MHYLQIKAFGPVGILFSKEIHFVKLHKKRAPINTGALFNICFITIYYFISTRRFNERPASVALEATGCLSPKA